MVKREHGLKNVMSAVFPDDYVCKANLRKGNSPGKTRLVHKSDIDFKDGRPVHSEICSQLSDRPGFRWMKWNYNFTSITYSTMRLRPTCLDGGENGASNQTTVKLLADAIKNEDNRESTDREVSKSWL